MTQNLNRLYRPLTSESLDSLPAATEIMSEFPAISPNSIRNNPSLTVISHGQIPWKQHRRLRGSEANLRYFVFPAPETGGEILTMPIKDVTFLDKQEWRRALAILLDDPANILENEMNFYLARLGREPRTISPHLQLLDVDSSHATTGLRQWVADSLPNTIRLDTLRPDPSLQPRNSSSLNPSPAEHELAPEITAVVTEPRTLRPIPASFLNSLRQK